MISDNIYDVNHRVPGAEEELKWLKILENGDRELAIDWLVKHNFRSIFKRADIFIKHPMFKRSDHDLHKDIIQEAIIGFIEEVDRFEIDRGWRLSTYAVQHIDMRMRRFLQTKTRVVAIPVHVHRIIMFFVRTKRANPKFSNEQLLVEWQEYAKEKSISAYMTAELIPTFLDMMHNTKLESEYAKDDDPEDKYSGIFDAIPMDTSTSRFDPQQRTSIEQCLQELCPRDRHIIRLRFGLYGDAQSLESVGLDIGLTRERVRQIQKDILYKLSKNPVIQNLFKAL